MRSGRSGGRARGAAASRTRWKDEDVLDVIQRSRDAGRETVVKGGVARLSFGSQGPGEDDDTLWVWDDEDLLPNGHAMVSARKITFDERWPYTGRRGWRPTSNKLSEAGFHFTPTEEEEDGCTCIYCGVELGGWERTDDPIHEHQRRRPNCPFFHCIWAQALETRASKRVPDESERMEDDDDVSTYEIPRARKKRTVSRTNSTHRNVSPEKDSCILSTEVERDTNKFEPPTAADTSVIYHSEEPKELVPAEAAATRITEQSAQTARITESEVEGEPELEAEPEQEPAFKESQPEQKIELTETESEQEKDEGTNVVTDPEPEAVTELEKQVEVEVEPHPGSQPFKKSALPTKSTQVSIADASDDEAAVERLVTMSTLHMGLALPNIYDFLPIPFPHRHSQSVMAPPICDPRKVTVVEWIMQQQTYLLETMRERMDQRLASVRRKNAEERKRLEKVMRS